MIFSHSIGVGGLDSGDHAADAELDLPKRVEREAMAFRHFGGGQFFDRIFTVGRHGAGVEHRPRKNMFDGGGMAGRHARTAKNSGIQNATELKNCIMNTLAVSPQPRRNACNICTSASKIAFAPSMAMRM